MYLEIYNQIGKSGEVRFNPYSYTYDGWNDEVEEYLETEPVFGKVESAPSAEDIEGEPIMVEVTDEGEKLRRTASKLRYRGVWRTEIVDE